MPPLEHYVKTSLHRLKIKQLCKEKCKIELGPFCDANTFVATTTGDMRKNGPIVIVDDDPDDQFLYTQAFESLALENEIIVFDNGKDALAFFLSMTDDPFLILCDINMPLMSGLELREAMCSSKILCNKNTPFIFMSTSASERDIAKASTLCTHGFFQKESSFKRHEDCLRRIVAYWSSCRSTEPIAA